MVTSIFQAILYRISCLQDGGNYDEALKICEKALLECSQSAEIRFQRAYLLFLLNRPLEALSDLDAILKIDSDYPTAQWLKAGVLRRIQGDFSPEVLAEYELASLDDPSNLYLKSELADILRANGRGQEAITLYETILNSSQLEEETLEIETHFSLGIAKMSVGDFSAARSAFQSVVDLSPNYPDAQEMLNALS